MNEAELEAKRVAKENERYAAQMAAPVEVHVIIAKADGSKIEIQFKGATSEWQEIAYWIYRQAEA